MNKETLLLTSILSVQAQNSNDFKFVLASSSLEVENVKNNFFEDFEVIEINTPTHYVDIRYTKFANYGLNFEENLIEILKEIMKVKF